MEDVQHVLACREWINARTKRTLDRNRILGVVAAGKGAENHLPYTIPKIVGQISDMGKGADILIGLNNGFECPTLLQRLPFLPDAQVIQLYTGEKPSSTTPARVFADCPCEGEPYHLETLDHPQKTHRIFVVHQRAGPYAAGKIRVLGDIYGSLLADSIERGWIPPEILVAFDAESQFLMAQEGAIPDAGSNGLTLIVSKLQKCPEIEILGASPKYAVYRKGLLDGAETLLPDFREQLPPIPWFLSAVHGRYPGYKWKPGGGTVGRTDAMISLIVVIATRYPGARTEDAHLSVLAHHAGLRGDISTDVVFTNQVPSTTDMTTDDPPQRAWVKQMFRWIANARALEMHYGRHNVRVIVSTGFPWTILEDLNGFRLRVRGTEKPSLQLIRKNLKRLWLAFVAFQEIKRKVSKSPDRLSDPRADASW